MALKCFTAQLYKHRSTIAVQIILTIFRLRLLLDLKLNPPFRGQISGLISGGWLLVSIFVPDAPSPLQLSSETSYRGISNRHNNKMFLTKSAMNELRMHLSFTQLRLQCSKQCHRRAFHVTNAANSTSETVDQYLSGQTDVQPHACGSFDENGLWRLAVMRTLP